MQKRPNVACFSRRSSAGGRNHELPITQHSHRHHSDLAAGVLCRLGRGGRRVQVEVMNDAQRNGLRARILDLVDAQSLLDAAKDEVNRRTDEESKAQAAIMNALGAHYRRGWIGALRVQDDIYALHLCKEIGITVTKMELL